MATPVEINQPTDNVICDKKGKATVVFNVRNILGHPEDFGVDIIPTDPAKNEWLSVNDRFWESRANAIHQLIVEITVPNTVASGKYAFKVRVYVKGHSEELFSVSEPVTLTFKKPAETQKVEPEKPIPITVPAKSSWLKYIVSLIASLISAYVIYAIFIVYIIYLALPQIVEQIIKQLFN